MKPSLTAIFLIAFVGCGSRAPKTLSTNDARGWTVSVDKFQATPTTSLLQVTIEASHPCQLVTSEPHSGVNRTLLFVPNNNGKHSATFSWRKEIDTQQPNGDTHLKTWASHKSKGYESHSGPSHVYLGVTRKVPVTAHFQQVARPKSTLHMFGDEVVIATNDDGKETTVTVLSDLSIPDTKTD